MFVCRSSLLFPDHVREPTRRTSVPKKPLVVLFFVGSTEFVAPFVFFWGGMFVLYIRAVHLAVVSLPKDCPKRQACTINSDDAQGWKGLLFCSS